MTWSKLSDDFADDCWTLSDAAFRLHVEGLVWNGRKLLDLRLPKDDVRRFRRPEAVRELVDGGWWLDDGDAYVIQHHGAYQRSREAVIAQQAANVQNGRKGGRPRKPVREVISRVTESVSGSVSTRTTPEMAAPATAERAETESVSESPTERDRTGQGSKKRATTEVEPTAWPTIRRCSDCRSPLDSAITEDTHPNCQEPAA